MRELVENKYGSVFVKEGNRYTIIRYKCGRWTLQHIAKGWEIMENGMTFPTSQEAKKWIMLNDKNDTF